MWSRKDVILQIYKVCENTEFNVTVLFISDIKLYAFVVLCGKYLNLSGVPGFVVSIVNFPHSCELNHCQLCKFLSEMEAK